VSLWTTFSKLAPQVGGKTLAFGLLLVGVGLAFRVWRRRVRRLDLGVVSDQWITQCRIGPHDPAH
jgi:hypothetical protein